MNRRPIEQVLQAHTSTIMAVPGVLGTGQGEHEGSPCIVVFVRRRTADLERAIPSSLEGYPVRLEQTGEIRPRDPA